MEVEAKIGTMPMKPYLCKLLLMGNSIWMVALNESNDFGSVLPMLARKVDVLKFV